MRFPRFFVTLIVLCAISSGQEPPPKQITSSVTIASPKEPGERLQLTIRVFQADAKTPAANQTLFIYHTDATGVYSKPTNSSSTPRLKGWARTDANGKIQVDTIKPRSYPSSANPAHVHVIFMDGDKRNGEDECWFEGDPFVTGEMKRKESAAGRFSRIVALKKNGSGVLFGEWNVVK